LCQAQRVLSLRNEFAVALNGESIKQNLGVAKLSVKRSRWGLDPIYSTKFESWEQLERSIAGLDNTKRIGDAFEQFGYFYLLYHKDFYDIDEVWCDKVKDRAIPPLLRTQYKLERKDYGVDGISRLRSGKLEAWQGKFRSDRSSPTYTELATFWSEAEYADSRRVIANCETLPAMSQKKAGHQQILVNSFMELDRDFFGALFEFANEETGGFQRMKYTPRPHQRAMIDNVVQGLTGNSRGKLIAAPGTGKTLAALWITEHDELLASKVLVLVPSIALVGQTLRQWTMHRNKEFSYLCVCSDQSVDTDIEENSDISTNELGFQVTTSIEDVESWMKATIQGRQYVFCTYHSSEVIEQAMKRANYKFDLIVFDEAHRTVGRADQLFALALQDERISSKKRLFMTATQRILNPRIKALAASAGVEVFSMCDERTYGPVLYEYSFGKAILDGVIADYEILLAEVSGQDVQNLIEVNRLLSIYTKQDGIGAVELTADQLFKAGFLLKALDRSEVGKVITFHSLRNRAVRFSRVISILAREITTIGNRSPYVSYVLGDQNSAERSERIASFESAQIGVLSNVQVLSEGVDIPMIDSVYFVDPKTSVIDIVQAIGRALRKPFGQGRPKTAKIIVPILVPEGAQTLDDVDWDNSLQTFHYVIQAMRAQDQRLEEEVNQINLYETTNGKSGYRVGSAGRIRVVAPAIELRQVIDLNSFLDRITLRIATANANPEGTKLGFSHLGKGQRKSEYKPVFSILGDYNPEIYYKQLVEPTINLFSDVNREIPKNSLKINHNNLSHTQRLGLIEETDHKLMRLTPIGQDLKAGSITFENVFRNQMLLYSSENGLYSYRLLIQLLIELDRLSHIEFLYGPYIIQNTGGMFDAEGVVERVVYIRDHFPRIEITGYGNRDDIRRQLNGISPVDIPDKDVWGDRSTPKNKFRYAKNALVLFDFIEGNDRSYKTPIRIKTEMKEEARMILERSDPTHAPMPNFYGRWYWIG